jgi:hypothetical protein
VPAVVNVCEALWPFFRVPVLKLPLLAVAVWLVGPLFVQVTLSPTWIVSDAGVNLKSEIVSTGSDALWARRECRWRRWRRRCVVAESGFVLVWEPTVLPAPLPAPWWRAWRGGVAAAVVVDVVVGGGVGTVVVVVVFVPVARSCLGFAEASASGAGTTATASAAAAQLRALRGSILIPMT